MSQNNKNSICLIHSDPDINNLFTIFLEHYGYHVNCFTNPSEGLLSLAEEQPDLVMCELIICENDDTNIYKTLKDIDNQVRILIITANLKCAELIQDKYPEIKNQVIIEPISLTKLKSEVESILVNVN